MSNNSLEIVCEGWLIKSPPTTRIFGARWRRRWFVLKHTGELPGQYFLCYYTDPTCKKLKGEIDLDQCEQVDTGLRFENNKHKYQHMFDVRTPKRIYYLAAQSEADMNRWVQCVCQVCGFKPYSTEDNLFNYSPTGDEGPSTPSTVTETLEPESESPPVSPTSTSSAYIPISECITGPPVTLTGPTASWRPAGATGPILHQLQPLPTKRSNLVATANHLPPGTLPSGTLTPGTLPPGTLPPGTLPPGTLPPGTLPPGTLPPGTLPSGTIPSGTLPPGTLPPGTLPPGTLPPGTLPPGITADEFYDSPRQLKPRPPAALDLRQGSLLAAEGDAQKSPGTDAESVFTDDEWGGGGGGGGVVNGRPAVNWETFPSGEGDTPLPRPSDSSNDFDLSGGGGGDASWGLTTRYGRIAVSGSRTSPPPRPPKPSHLLLDPNASSHNYLNIENVSPAPSTGTSAGAAAAAGLGAFHHKADSVSASGSEPPSPLVTTSTPLDGPAAVPGSSVVVSDEMYDFPRSHQYEGDPPRDPTRPLPSARHCYSNAAPGQVNGDVFTYDFQQGDCCLGENLEEPTSPRSESSSVSVASNLPSPSVDAASLGGGSVSGSGLGLLDAGAGSLDTPPAVNRGLKPRRKMSDSAASSEPSPGLGPGPGLSPSLPSPGLAPPSAPLPLGCGPIGPIGQALKAQGAKAHGSKAYGPKGPPNVDRKLKPRKHPDDILCPPGSLTLSAVPAGRRRPAGGGTASLRKARPGAGAAMGLNQSRSSRSSRSEHCSSSDDDLHNSPDDDLYHFQQDGHSFRSSGKELKYLDLDLDKDSGPCGVSLSSGLSGGSFHTAPKSPEKAPVNPTGTVYKTVDFVKTEAFNRTRLRVEEERYRGDNAPTSLGAK